MPDLKNDVRCGECVHGVVLVKDDSTSHPIRCTLAAPLADKDDNVQVCMVSPSDRCHRGEAKTASKKKDKPEPKPEPEVEEEDK